MTELRAEKLPLFAALRRYGPRIRELTNQSEGKGSAFQDWIGDCPQFGDHIAILAFEGDEIVGQSLSSETGPTLRCGFYVDPQKRRKGVGRFLFKTAFQEYGAKMAVSPWDDRSTAFVQIRDLMRVIARERNEDSIDT